MNAVDILLIILIAAVLAVAVFVMVKSRRKGGMCSCCDQAGTCMKNKMKTDCSGKERSGQR